MKFTQSIAVYLFGIGLGTLILQTAAGADTWQLKQYVAKHDFFAFDKLLTEMEASERFNLEDRFGRGDGMSEDLVCPVLEDVLERPPMEGASGLDYGAFYERISLHIVRFGFAASAISEELVYLILGSLNPMLRDIILEGRNDRGQTLLMESALRRQAGALRALAESLPPETLLATDTTGRNTLQLILAQATADDEEIVGLLINGFMSTRMLTAAAKVAALRYRTPQYPSAVDAIKERGFTALFDELNNYAAQAGVDLGPNAGAN